MYVNKYLISSTSFLDNSGKEKTSLLEFPVTPSTECSRVSSRSYVFTLDTDSLLITFANESGEEIILAAQTFSVKFSDVIKSIKMYVFALISSTKKKKKVEREFQQIHLIHRFSQFSLAHSKTQGRKRYIGI